MGHYVDCMTIEATCKNPDTLKQIKTYIDSTHHDGDECEISDNYLSVRADGMKVGVTCLNTDYIFEKEITAKWFSVSPDLTITANYTICDNCDRGAGTIIWDTNADGTVNVSDTFDEMSRYDYYKSSGRMEEFWEDDYICFSSFWTGDISVRDIMEHKAKELSHTELIERFVDEHCGAPFELEEGEEEWLNSNHPKFLNKLRRKLLEKAVSV